MDKYLIANINMFSLNNQVFLVDDFTREPCQIGVYNLADLPQALVQIAYDNDRDGNLVGNFLTLKVHNLFNSTDEFVDSISNHYIEKIEINLFNSSQKTIFFNEKKVIEKGKKKNINKEILVYKNCVCILISKYKMKLAFNILK